MTLSHAILSYRQLDSLFISLANGKESAKAPQYWAPPDENSENWGALNSSYKGPVMWKLLPYEDVTINFGLSVLPKMNPREPSKLVVFTCQDHISMG